MAHGYNKTTIMGNLTKDVELRYIPSGTAVCDFTLAVTTKKSKDKEDTAFIECTAWAKAAEVIAQFMAKGKTLLVDGWLKQENWEDKSSGSKRSKLKLTVENFTFFGGVKSESKPVAQKPQAEESFDAGSDIPF